ncbi:MAG: A/G-specific adenine glycosylase [Flavobacteriaceae bacterium]|nr:MAG: A/G-specific adenine glycosylase [Flavobacteriaceae bacterium]
MNVDLLLDWYGINKRELPWREDKDPYKVWISEIILQQTRVKQGLDYFYRLIEAFPSVEDLAHAKEQEVLKLWQGLGYYSRARNLRLGAESIVKSEKFPEDFKGWLQIKGVGRYTAAAICSICYNHKTPAIDGNALRVYTRVFALEIDIHKSSSSVFLFEKISEMLQNKKLDMGDLNQAIMDLGSSICVPKNPSCTSCPLKSECLAYQTGKTHLYPFSSKKIKTTNREIHYVFYQFQDLFYLKQRKQKDIWQGLFDFPEMAQKPVEDLELIHSQNHLLTHQRLQLSFWHKKIDSRAEFELIGEKNNYTVAQKNDLDKFPVPKPLADFLKKFVP